MCPGGVIAPCATKNNEIVTNGWSPSQRNYPTANSGIVIELKVDDFKKYSSFGPLAGVEFQKILNRKHINYQTIHKEHQHKNYLIL